MEEILYIHKQTQQQKQYEALCKRCGSCCGAFDGDPCSNLAMDEENKYYCRVYDERFGPQKTLSGKIFNCVPIRELVKRFDRIYNSCAYF